MYKLLTQINKMKGYLFLIIISFVSCAKEIVITEDDIKTDVFYAKQGLKPYTGACKIYYTDTELIKEEFRFKKGRLHGESFSYYRSGNLMWKGSYENGLMSGKWQRWDDAGNLIMELHYDQDTLNGPFITMYPDGKIKEKGNYSQNKRVREWIVREKSEQVISNL